jgi:hypothetical protein
MADEIFDIAKLVVVAFERSVLPESVVEASVAEVVTLRMFAANPALKVLSAEKTFVVVVPNAVANTPVDELYESGYCAERLDDDILLLKEVKSAVERYPSWLRPDCVIENVAVEGLYARC